MKQSNFTISAGSPSTTLAQGAESEMHPVHAQTGGAKAQIMSTLWLIALSIAAGVAGQTLLKLGASQPGDAGIAAFNPLAIVLMIFKSPWMMGGMLLYGVGALSWIMVLSRLDLSYAYPFLALNFVLVALVSRMVLGESIPLMRWVGIGLICAGIIVIANSTQQG
jgi:multidrug transporter EmrE-like cation transporter